MLEAVANTPNTTTTTTTTIKPPQEILNTIVAIQQRQGELRQAIETLEAQANAVLFKGMAELGLKPSEYGFDYQAMSYMPLQKQEQQ